MWFQYKIYKSVSEVPTELIGVLDNETLIKARDYNIDKTRFGFFASVWNQLLTTVRTTHLLIIYLLIIFLFSDNLMVWSHSNVVAIVRTFGRKVWLRIGCGNSSDFDICFGRFPDLNDNRLTLESIQHICHRTETRIQ